MKVINYFKCKLGFHDYFAIKKLSSVAAKIGCRNCKKLYAMNHELEMLIPWDWEVESFYANRWMEI